MSWKSRLAQPFVGFLSPQDLQEIAGQAVVQITERMTPEERSAFFQRFVEEHMSSLLAGLGREERVSLMNGLLPRLAQEFPLADLDILGAFSAAGGSPWDEEG